MEVINRARLILLQAASVIVNTYTHGRNLPASVYAIHKDVSISKVTMDQVTIVIECSQSIGPRPDEVVELLLK